MKIKVEKTNAVAIEAALRAVNGRACDHAYTMADEIEKIAQECELQMLELVGSKKAAVGALAESTSGKEMPNAYRYSRIGTTVTIQRCASGWFLVGVASATLYQAGGRARLTLTAEQDSRAVARFRSQYQVAD
jgi:hypothetical protein